jgi:hypothetical protein
MCDLEDHDCRARKQARRGRVGSNRTTEQPNNRTTKQQNNQTTEQPNNRTTKQQNINKTKEYRICTSKLDIGISVGLYRIHKHHTRAHRQKGEARTRSIGWW